MTVHLDRDIKKKGKKKKGKRKRKKKKEKEEARNGVLELITRLD